MSNFPRIWRAPVIHLGRWVKWDKLWVTEHGIVFKRCFIFCLLYVYVMLSSGRYTMWRYIDCLKFRLLYVYVIICYMLLYVKCHYKFNFIIRLLYIHVLVHITYFNFFFGKLNNQTQWIMFILNTLVINVSLVYNDILIDFTLYNSWLLLNI